MVVKLGLGQTQLRHHLDQHCCQPSYRPGHFVFSGNVKIDAICNTDSEYIVLHAGDSFGFEVTKVGLNGAPGNDF